MNNIVRFFGNFSKNLGLIALVSFSANTAIAQCIDSDGDGFGVELEQPCKTTATNITRTFTFSEMPTVRHLGESSVEISYSMTAPGRSQVHYGTENTDRSTPYSSSSSTATFKFTIGGLSTNTKYYYKVSALKNRASRDRRFQSAIYSFTTSDKTASTPEIILPSTTSTTTTTTTTTKAIEQDPPEVTTTLTTVPTTTSTISMTKTSDIAETAGPCVDSDGDGWGWDGIASCIMPPPVAAAKDGTKTESDPTNEVTNATAIAEEVENYLFYSGNCFDIDGDGYGFDNIRKESCRLSPDNKATYDNTENPRIEKDYGDTNLQIGTCIDKEGDGWGSNTYLATQPNVRSSCRMPSDWRNSKLNLRSCYHQDELYFGNVVLQNNQWNKGAMLSEDFWLCTELTGDAAAPAFRWQYDFLENTQGQANAVKAYPQVYYGTKEGATPSGTVSQLGLPISLKDAENFKVSYKFSEKGFGERNVALESFFHSGGCNVPDHDNFNSHNEEYEHIEMMVWVGRPISQAPGSRRIGEFLIDGRKWNLWLNERLGWSYLAFASEKTIPEATLDWGKFIEFSKNWLAKNHEKYPHLVPMEDDMCFRAIEMGTEIFHGKGEFTLHKFEVSRE